MTQVLLITQADFTKYEDINVNINAGKKLDPYIYQAQFIDLKSAIGEEMYYDLISDSQGSPAYSKYADLINGSTYTIGSVTYTHEGLKPVLCYFAHSRYILNKNDNDTAYGLVGKKSEFSEPSPEKALIRKSDYSNSIANAYLIPVIKFLNDHAAEYSLWRSDCGCNSNRKIKQTRRISSI